MLIVVPAGIVTVAKVLSPLRNVVESFVPEAPSLAIGTVPLAKSEALGIADIHPDNIFHKKNKNGAIKYIVVDPDGRSTRPFLSLNTAKYLKERITKEVTTLNKKIKVKKINTKETQVILGPYNSVNSLKNDYIKLKTFGFEELDIFLNE